jgi:hypothetical protein
VFSLAWSLLTLVDGGNLPGLGMDENDLVLDHRNLEGTDLRHQQRQRVWQGVSEKPGGTVPPTDRRRSVGVA